MAEVSDDIERRREMGPVIGLISDRIDGVERQTEKNAKSIADHVLDCARMQKRVLVVSCLILIWIVGHSAEAAKTASGLLDILKVIL